MAHNPVNHRETEIEGTDTTIEIALYFQKYMYSLLQRLQSKRKTMVYVTRNRLGKWFLNWGKYFFLTNEYSPYSCHRKINNKSTVHLYCTFFQPKREKKTYSSTMETY